MKFNLNLAELLTIGVKPTIVGFLNYYGHLPLTDENIESAIDDLRTYNTEAFECTDTGILLGTRYIAKPAGYVNIRGWGDVMADTSRFSGWVVNSEGGLMENYLLSTSTDITFHIDDGGNGDFLVDTDDMKLGGSFTTDELSYTVTSQANGVDVTTRYVVNYSSDELSIEINKYENNDQTSVAIKTSYDVSSFLTLDTM